jgi:hypothetical protein
MYPPEAATLAASRSPIVVVLLDAGAEGAQATSRMGLDIHAADSSIVCMLVKPIPGFQPRVNRVGSFCPMDPIFCAMT